MVGTRNAIPVSFPTKEGMTLVTALAAPVEEGMMLPEAARPPRQSFAGRRVNNSLGGSHGMDSGHEGHSTISNSSWIALTIGASPLVVQEAQEMKSSVPS